MNVLIVEPGLLPYEKEINGLSEMQAAVGGLIQPIYPYEDKVAIVCNEEGLLQNLPFNRSVPGGYGGVFGTFFICGLDESDFCSLTPEQVAHFKKEFSQAELLLDVKGNDLVTFTFPAEPKQEPPKSKGHTAPGHDR